MKKRTPAKKKVAAKKRAPATKTKKKAPRAKPESTQMDPAFAPIAEAFAGKPGVMSGKMMASFGLRLHGKIFAMHVRGNLVVKLPKARVDALVAQRVGKPFEPGPGRVMKEWLSVPPGSGDWLALSREAFAFAGG